MAGVREQGGGIAEIAVDRLGHDEGGVERNADRERLAEIGGRMDMAVTVVVTMTRTMVGVIMVMMTVMVVAAQF
ncbi:hypothetical protein BwSH20_26900 [Bradyrhizobium ottawaense]|nr:hypothetical protein SG09_60400 [Bradyrhizobium ottawaense]BBO12193.1 hypothetical protein TM102_36630 [Bradyrhizobium sp. TM102]GMO47589.1 hypothetical protein BwSF21_65330 [Bradyrhizobium ottawaense]GMO50835.1 hypothetical protein BwSH14_72030 [Bradyrhizobium ottawaense]GMO55426.1 hypothetical protein BwSF12_69850 [Bradyrhizobium ottawaense]